MKIFASLFEDAQQGWVWSNYCGLPPRSVVQITNASNGRSIWCESLVIDGNYLRRYNDGGRIHIESPSEAIVMNEWYRSKLGYRTQETVQAMTIAPANNLWGRFRACTDHPQVVVRVAAWLGFIGVVLGILGIALGILSLS
jgi:hypothetical protein